jgi:hypothetical protein
MRNQPDKSRKICRVWTAGRDPHSATREVEPNGLGCTADPAVGMCLRCGRRLTLCGAPFTGEITCRKCNYINIYNESQQPVSGR